MIFNITSYLFISMILFFFALVGIIINRRSVIIVLLSIELIFLAVNFNFIIFSVYLDDLIGQLIALFILTVAAAESAVGLAILVIYYRIRNTISIDSINLIQGLVFLNKSM